MEELDRRIQESNAPELVGVAELASLLSVSRQRASELARSRGFPAPSLLWHPGRSGERPRLRGMSVGGRGGRAALAGSQRTCGANPLTCQSYVKRTEAYEGRSLLSRPMSTYVPLEVRAVNC